MWSGILASITAFFKSLPVIGEWLKRRQERRYSEMLAEGKANALERLDQKNKETDEAIRKARLGIDIDSDSLPGSKTPE